MKKLHVQVLLASAATIVALLASLTAIIGAEKQDELPAYLATAKYLTTTKCLMCHKGLSKDLVAEYAKTKHASFKDKQPWDADKVPPAEVLYRYVTGATPDLTTAEKGVGCEACHGPGSAHMSAGKDTRKNVISMPNALDTAGKKLSLCGRCHGQYTIGDKQHYAANFLPGQDLTKLDGFKLDAAQPGKPMQEWNELVTSKHLTSEKAKDITCITCHTAHDGASGPHQLRKPVVELCTSCHKDKTMADHAPKAAADATCATCHMPNGAHTFAKPAK